MNHQVIRTFKVDILGLLLVLITVTGCFSETTYSERIVTVDEAIAGGFPIYLPSPELARTLNLDFPPIITEERTRKPFDPECASLTIEFYSKKPKKPQVRIRVSNGCALPPVFKSIERIDLEWGRDSEADIFSRAGGRIIVNIIERTRSFQYVVFYTGTLTSTLEFLESMEYVRSD